MTAHDKGLSDKGFLARWSARKVALKEGKPITEPLNTLAPQAAPSLPLQTAPPEDHATQGLQEVPALTLDDVAALTPTCDFSGFVAKGVDSAVKNAAMKKLFTDPHYNIMDGLDIYIGDYSTHAPMPQSVIDDITKDGFLNMFQKEEVALDATSATSAASTTTPTKALLDDHPDLQLQRDDALGREGLGDSALDPSENTSGLETAHAALSPPST